MITAENIIDEINRLIVEKYPDNTVYIDECLKDFERPSFLIESGREDRDDINKTTIEVKSDFTITCHGTVDNHFRSKTSELRSMQNTVMNLFRTGFITVGDRSLNVKASNGGMTFDRSWIDLYFEFNDDRSDQADNTPLIGEVRTTLKEG